MSSKTRRTLEEIVARYELHPDICDIYVEGESDKDILRWFFDSNDRSNVIVYPITEIEISADHIDQRKLGNNNRGRVILLAAHLEQELERVPTVTCLIDADMDYALGVPPPTGLLLRTDFSSMDMYGYDATAVLKVARLLGCDLNKTGREILNELSVFLQRLFLHRLVNHRLELRLQWIDAHRCCTLNASVFEFDEGEFRRRYLNRAGIGSEDKKTFEHELRKCENMKDLDTRFIIRGNDFIETLAWYFSRHIARPPHPDAKLVRRMLFATLPLEQLLKYSLFTALLKRTAPCERPR
jgi:hypothetical protein